MGTPISGQVDQETEWLAREYWLSGKPMDLELFVRGGFDILFLKAKFKLFKPQIPYLPGLKTLKSHMKSLRVEVSQFDTIEDSDKLLDTQCLRLSDDDDHSILSLHPTRGGRFPAFEIFVTRRGGWIILLDENDDEGVFLSKVETIDELDEELDMCLGNNHRFEFYPRYPLMEIAAWLDYTLEDSIEERRERLQRQERVLKKMCKFNKRVTLST
jgi:hypothetical protein